MGFGKSLRTCLVDKYATFSGRAPRSEFWFFFLFCALGTFVTAFVSGKFGSVPAFTLNSVSGLLSGQVGFVAIPFMLFNAVVWIPTIAVTVRRFHDVDLAGWWYLPLFLLYFFNFMGLPVPALTSLLGAGSIAALLVEVRKGTSGDNRYGLDPLREPSVADVFA